MQILLIFILHLKSERSGRSKNSCKFSSFSFLRDKHTNTQTISNSIHFGQVFGCGFAAASTWIMNKNKNFHYAALRGRCAAARPARVCHMKNNIKNHFQKQKTTQNINKHSKNVLKMIMQTLLFFILHLKSERSGRSKNSCKFSSFSFFA